MAPRKGYYRRRSRKAYADPVPFYPGGKYHHYEYKHDDKRAAQIGGDAHYQTEQQHKVYHQLEDRPAGIQIFVFLQIRYLLCQDNDEHYLDDLRRLYADAEESQPAFVAGAAVVAQWYEYKQEQHVEDAQVHPFIGDNISVDDRQHDKCRYAQQQRQHLNKHEFIGVIIGKRG